MADYCCAYRTNYYRVTDEIRYKQLLEGMPGGVYLFEKDADGQMYHGFGAYDTVAYYLPASEDESVKEMVETGVPFYDVNGEPIDYKDIDNESFLYNEHGAIYFDRYDSCNDGGFDWFISELQKILHPEDCFVYIESGHERLKYVGCYVLVVTKEEIKTMFSDDYINSTVKELFGENAEVDYAY